MRMLLVCLALVSGPVHAAAQTLSNAVTDWEGIVEQAIHNAAAPRPPAGAFVLHAMAMLAVYDAVVAIEGRYEPYAVKIRAQPDADVRAAVATAAYVTTRGRIAPSQIAELDQRYADYLAGMRDGHAKTAGIAVGRRAGAAMLKLRADDGFGAIVPYHCSANPPPPGEFEPNTGCPTSENDPQPIDAKLAFVKPFTFRNPSRFRPSGPDALTSHRYTRDFIAVRDFGRSDSAFRSAEQTDTAYFWSENAYVHWNRNLIALATAYRLNLPDTARLFAMVHTAAADALITGFDAKYFYTYWRPRTAIPRADSDGNPDTDADPTWTPLLQVNHPEYPSAHGFLSTAVTDAVSAFFGTNHITWRIATSQAAVPQLVKRVRTYHNLNDITREVDDARVWSGLHWRHSMRDGDRIGRMVARHVVEHFFRRTH